MRHHHHRGPHTVHDGCQREFGFRLILPRSTDESVSNIGDGRTPPRTGVKGDGKGELGEGSSGSRSSSDKADEEQDECDREGVMISAEADDDLPVRRMLEPARADRDMIYAVAMPAAPPSSVFSSPKPTFDGIRGRRSCQRSTNRRLRRV